MPTGVSVLPIGVGVCGDQGKLTTRLANQFSPLSVPATGSLVG